MAKQKMKAARPAVRATEPATTVEPGVPRPASLQENASESVPRMVNTSTMYLAVAVALVAGLYIGSVLPSFLAGGPRQQTSESAVQQTQATQQQKNLDRLAPHILELEETLRKKPDDVTAWVQLGNLYFDTGKAMNAINAYERALLLKPGDPNVLTDLGIMYREMGKFDMAVESFRKASIADPRHQNALFNRGVVLYFDLARKDDARKSWQQLLEINPKATTPDGKLVQDMLRDLK